MCLLLLWLDSQGWSTLRYDQHRNGFGGFCLTRAFADRVNDSRRLEEAPSRIFASRMTLQDQWSIHKSQEMPRRLVHAQNAQVASWRLAP
jgi:hypothetical protein